MRSQTGSKAPLPFGAGRPRRCNNLPGAFLCVKRAANLRGLNPERAPWAGVRGQCSSLAENMDVVLGCGLLEWGH